MRHLGLGPRLLRLRGRNHHLVRPQDIGLDPLGFRHADYLVHRAVHRLHHGADGGFA